MELESIKGIGPVRLEALRAMGICSLRDLLFTLPVRYEDRTKVSTICSVHDGMSVCIRGSIASEPVINRFGGMTRVTALFRDDTGTLTVCWYNQPWMKQQMNMGRTVELFGKIVQKKNGLVFQNPVLLEKRELHPIYKKIPGFPEKSFRKVIRALLDSPEECCAETLPGTMLARYGLFGIREALIQAHFPENTEKLRQARRRVNFERLLRYQVFIRELKKRKADALPLAVGEDLPARWWSSVPFQATDAQKRVLEEIRHDLNQPVSMSRMVQGDVGCGKTAIAFGAICMACRSGGQCAMMAPTDILARQHYENARRLLEPLGISCGLMTGSLTPKERKEAHEATASGKWQAVFGTHALISAGVTYQNLVLAVTDEQHRFGVRQRTTLQEKGKQGELYPHVLVMSATPIPRSLALILYGDLDISVVDELPPGRKTVRTRIVPERKRSDMYAFVKNEVKKGRQAYIVCPLVENGEEDDETASVLSLYESLKENELRGLRVGVTWGGQEARLKNSMLAEFGSGALDVLISTTVIEVGINVPNATVMIIEDANRFGMSQLHQLRGRVGRGREESWCFLLGKENERLRTMTETNDGFVIAQKDLELRGPGDLLGTRQSGEATISLILDGDVRLLEETSRCADRLFADPELAPELAMIRESSELYGMGELIRPALN